MKSRQSVAVPQFRPLDVTERHRAQDTRIRSVEGLGSILLLEEAPRSAEPVLPFLSKYHYCFATVLGIDVWDFDITACWLVEIWYVNVYYRSKAVAVRYSVFVVFDMRPSLYLFMSLYLFCVLLGCLFVIYSALLELRIVTQNYHAYRQTQYCRSSKHVCMGLLCRISRYFVLLSWWFACFTLIYHKSEHKRSIATFYCSYCTSLNHTDTCTSYSRLQNRWARPITNDQILWFLWWKRF